MTQALVALPYIGQLTAFTVFLLIAGIGFVFLLISLVIGELFEHGIELVGDGLDHGGPSFLSTRILSVFVTAFGGTGAIATNMGAGLLASSLVGGLTGFAFSGLIFAFASFLHSQQASSDIRREDLIGKTAEVTVGIPQGGLGQIRCRIGDTFIDRIARASDGTAVPPHSVVKIESDIGETVLVSRPFNPSKE